MDHDSPKKYLVQKFMSLSENGEGVWVSLAPFKTEEEAKKYSSSLDSRDKAKIIEAVCETAK